MLIEAEAALIRGRPQPIEVGRCIRRVERAIEPLHRALIELRIAERVGFAEDDPV